jgi:hypothetical protein
VAHPDLELLVLIALGDTAAPDHLNGCEVCHAEVERLRAAAALGRQTQEVRDLPPPPAAVWTAIATATGVEPSTVDEGAPLRPSARTGRRVADPAPPGGPGRPRRSGRRSDRRSWRRLGIRVAALVAAVAVGVAGTLAATRLLRDDPAATLACGTVVARADLTALPLAPPGATGEARVLCDGPERRLQLHVTGLPLQPGYYEVWLIDPNTMEMTAIGQLGDGNDVLLPLTSTADLRKYRLVDVSAEQYDNNQAHSGVSMLRGQLTT